MTAAIRPRAPGGGPCAARPRLPSDGLSRRAAAPGTGRSRPCRAESGTRRDRCRCTRRRCRRGARRGSGSGTACWPRSPCPASGSRADCGSTGRPGERTRGTYESSRSSPPGRSGRRSSAASRRCARVSGTSIASGTSEPSPGDQRHPMACLGQAASEVDHDALGAAVFPHRQAVRGRRARCAWGSNLGDLPLRRHDHARPATSSIRVAAPAPSPPRSISRSACSAPGWRCASLPARLRGGGTGPGGRASRSTRWPSRPGERRANAAALAGAARAASGRPDQLPERA